MMSKILNVIVFLCVLPIASMERPADYGHDQLLKAVWAGDLNQVHALLNSGVNPNFYKNPDKSDFALTEAARNANPAIVQLLLKFSADPSIDQNILCASYMSGPGKFEDPIAFSERRFKVMQLLILDPRTNLNCIDSEGNTVLMKAVQTRFKKLIKLLLNKSDRLDMTIKNKEGNTVHDLTKNKNIQDLLEEAETKSILIRKVPEKMAINPEIKKEPIKFAQPQPPASTLDPRVQLFNAIVNKNTQAIIDILNTGLNPNASITSTNLSPLMVAASINSVTAMKILLHTQFIDPNKKNRDGDTALIIATRAGAVEAVAELLDHQEVIDNINLENNMGLTAFDVANEKQYGHWLKIAQMLSAKGGAIGSSAERKPISQPQAARPIIPDATYKRLSPTLNNESIPQEILGFAKPAEGQKEEQKPTQDQIRKAYRMLTLKWHPDKNPGDPEAANIFALINWAYEQLTKSAQ